MINNVRIKYLLNKKKIYDSDDLRLLGSNFDASEYTFVANTDIDLGNIMHGMNFKRVIVKNKNIRHFPDCSINCMYKIFSDACSGKFTCKSIDIDINIVRFNRTHYENILRICELIVEILKSHTVNKFHIILPGYLDSFGCKKFFIDHLANISKINIEWINPDSINGILRKNANITKLNIRQLDNIEKLRTYANMTSLTHLHISCALIANDSIIMSKIFANNKITSVVTDTNVIESYPDIMNLLTKIKKFKLTIQYLSDISTIDHICNCLKKIELNKFVLTRSIIPKILHDYLSECAVPKIKFKNELDYYQLLSILSNPNLKYIVTDMIHVKMPIHNYSCNLDHLNELHVIINDQDQINSFTKFLERSFTDNSEIQYIGINGTIIDSLYILDLMNRNLDYKLNRLYKVTKPIMVADN